MRILLVAARLLVVAMLLALASACESPAPAAPTAPAQVATPTAPAAAVATPATGGGRTGPTRLELAPAAANAQVGQVTELTLQLVAGTQAVDGVEVHLDFDPTKLQLVDAGQTAAAKIEKQAKPFDIELMNRADNASGRVDLAMGTFAQPRPTGTIPLATIRFKALAATGDAGTTVRFVFDQPSNRLTEVAAAGASMLGPAQDAKIVVK